ncbi:MICOS complex subunit MIC13-like [Limulus polyphemus]|uniref:MICOS complex subunit MIC13 n=1 Tax=Limulus polyphemus TaxID=6850 RepID=A0ABM1B603_LIMPO|nr:MICOS complex subunit MIC13-like [Limulus polyphemus]
MVMSLVKVALKLGIGVGAVYVTVDQGIWSEGTQASDAFHKVANIMPGAREYAQKIPERSELSRKAVSYWNCGVMYTCSALANLPSVTKDYSRKGIAMARNSIASTLEK